MGTVSAASPEKMYSWWWDSHKCPKNSKWLQENLTDMDVKVKQMIKLIEEDADSFARRAEMYYKKRPELMTLVEEFYRAYRALAERYDHVTGVIRQAHRSMAEAFPNQVPFVLVDDLPASLTTEVYLGSPDMSPTSGPFDLRELQKDALQMSPPNFHSVMRNGSLVQESDSIDSKKGLGQFNELLGPAEGGNHVKSVERRVRKALNFQDAEIKELGEQKGVTESLKAQAPSESERMTKAELEIRMLKTALSNLETEKETGLLQYQQSLERLSNLESEVSCAKEDSKGLNERASKAEAEVKILKESLEKLDAERHASFLQYQECVEKISNMENYISEAQKDADDLNDRASKAETEAQFLTQDLARLEVEKESSLVLYNQCLEKISDMEAKLLHAKETARRSNERADKADKEVEALMQALAIMVEEKEAAAVKYNKCLETITILEHKLTFAQEDATRLNSKIDDGVAKFKDAEERCLQLERSNRILNSELESLTRKMAAQSGELTEKQKDLGRLWTSLQEERLRCVEAETAFQTLQRTHSQSQEELRSLATEVQKRVGKIEDLEAVNKRLENEVGQIKVENKGLNEVNLSLALTVQHLKAEISCLRETHGKLEAEVELRVDQRNALQQEIYGLKEELKSLNMKHHSLVEQVESLGIGPDCFVSHVRDLQEENIKLKQVSETVGEDEEAFLQKLVVMDQLVEKNIVLEDSLSELNAELEYVRDKVKALEESCKSLQDERSALLMEKSMMVSQLQIASDNLDQLSETKMFVEKSLLDANSELEGLRVKSKCLEDSCRLLDSRSCSREMDIQQLRDRVCDLDVENGELKAQILAHAEVLISFRDCVAALECCFVKHTLQDIDKNEGKDSTSNVCANSYQETTEKPDAVLAGGLLDLKELQARIKAIEMATVEKGRHLLLENSMANSKLEAAMRQIEDLKSKSSLPRERIRKGKHVNLMVRPDQNKDLKPLKGAYEISEERSEVTTKDIMLDETSECSSIGFSNSRRDTTEADDPLEIWEAAFNEGSIDLTVEKAPKVTRSRSQRKHHSREHQRRRTESFAEKEVGVDKLEVPRSSSGSCHEVHERKILEILDSDAQKLTNLHITVQDLKRTVEVTEKSRKGISIEYDSVKEQLEESEEAIIKLFNVNLRLKRNMEIESPSLEDNSPLASTEKGSIKRRKIAEQARKVSEKIGRLQLEVQKLQFLLLKLDDQNKTRPKIKIMERKTRVLLRDYLYSSGTRTRLQKPKKGHFCACAQPSTRGD